ncbi:hypothetical protein SDC9_209308 [bioreactor metagenome]|uniref:Uncharacterized protein n=1 Tax=bioreactor metagenome TaxID=1076179 RepID=A0A645JER1_9ZZZZ
MLFDEALRQGKAKATPAIPPRHQGVEDLVADLLRNPGAVVDDLQFQCQLETTLGQRDLPCHPGAQADLSAALKGLRGIAGDVEDGLDQLLTVGGQLRQTGVVVTANHQVGKLGQDQPPNTLKHVVDVDLGRPHHAVRGQ